MLQRLKRFFRAPATIVGVLGFITLAGIVGASLPQAGSASAVDLEQLRSHGRLATLLVDRLGLDHVFQTPAFLLGLGLATVSLCIVVAEQIRRLRTGWRLQPTEAHFRVAPFQTEFLRPARDPAVPRVRVRVRGRQGLAGSPLFHVGLLMVIAAATLRALFGVSAAVDLLERETLPATVEAWGAQWPGPLAKPFKLDAPLTLERVEMARYPSGGMKDLAVQFQLEGSESLKLGINQELRTSRGRLYVNSELGPAALLEWSNGHGPLHREALLLRQEAPGVFSAHAGQGLVLHARTTLSEAEPRPSVLELRVTEGPALRFVGRLSPGDTAVLPGGGSVHLVHLPFWARLHGDHDPGLWLVYAGFLLGLLGSALTYTVIRVDERVSITPEGDQERVAIAMKPHRFAPLFKERFERLVREHGGWP
ncbi:MAG: cytochrome c biogenesis protein ResB [Holophagaceae bacterium]|nr:cytochrome c biogenesis protein ResB [Holophagaceae bacterium]